MNSFFPKKKHQNTECFSYIATKYQYCEQGTLELYLFALFNFLKAVPLLSVSIVFILFYLSNMSWRERYFAPLYAVVCIVEVTIKPDSDLLDTGEHAEEEEMEESEDQFYEDDE